MPRLSEVPGVRQLVWARLGDMAGHAEAAWISLAGGPDLRLPDRSPSYDRPVFAGDATPQGLAVSDA